MRERPISDHEFERYLSEEKLMGCRCDECGTLFVPPRAICAKCHGAPTQWVQMQGQGKLAAFTCIAIGPPSMVEEGFSRDHPYCCGVVELVEGPRVVARIVEVEPLHPQHIKIGTPLRAKFLHRKVGEKAETILAFRLE